MWIIELFPNPNESQVSEFLRLTETTSELLRSVVGTQCVDVSLLKMDVGTLRPYVGVGAYHGTKTEYFESCLLGWFGSDLTLDTLLFTYYKFDDLNTIKEVVVIF